MYKFFTILFSILTGVGLMYLYIKHLATSKTDSYIALIMVIAIVIFLIILF